MKKVYSIFVLLAMIVVTLSFTACGGDDDKVNESQNYASKFSDTWKFTEINGLTCKTLC